MFPLFSQTGHEQAGLSGGRIQRYSEVRSSEVDIPLRAVLRTWGSRATCNSQTPTDGGILGREGKGGPRLPSFPRRWSVPDHMQKVMVPGSPQRGFPGIYCFVCTRVMGEPDTGIFPVVCWPTIREAALCWAGLFG